MVVLDIMVLNSVPKVRISVTSRSICDHFNFSLTDFNSAIRQIEKDGFYFGTRIQIVTSKLK